MQVGLVENDFLDKSARGIVYYATKDESEILHVESKFAERRAESERGNARDM